jgi:hypothetical protein
VSVIKLADTSCAVGAPLARSPNLRQQNVCRIKYYPVQSGRLRAGKTFPVFLAVGDLGKNKENSENNSPATDHKKYK